MTAFVTPENSTIVRTKSASTSKPSGKKRKMPIALRFTRATLRVLSPHAPTLAAAWAERLFLTARRRDRRNWEKEALASATPGRVSHQGGWIPTWTWTPTGGSAEGTFSNRKTVILVHGWEGRGSQLATFVPSLLEQGFRVVTFDAPGHGDSTLSRASVVEHARALCAVARSFGPIYAVIGHSVGGAAALFATRIGLDAERFALVSPPTSPANFAAMFGKVLDLDPTVHTAMIRRLEARYNLPIAEIDARLDAMRLRHTPILVIHDREDSVVSFDEGRSIAMMAARGELVETRGLGHQAILRAPEVIRKVANFVGNNSDDPSFTETLEGELYCRDYRYV